MSRHLIFLPLGLFGCGSQALLGAPEGPPVSEQLLQDIQHGRQLDVRMDIPERYQVPLDDPTAGPLDRESPRLWRGGGFTRPFVGHVEVISGAEPDPRSGRRLTNTLESLPANLEFWGASVLTSAELFGTSDDPGLCLAPTMRYDFDHDGEPWEAQFLAPSIRAMFGEPVDELRPLPKDCIAALLEVEGDVGAAIDDGRCDDLDELSHLQEGSACRACVASEGGDFEGCVEQSQCPLEAPSWAAMVEGGEQRFYRVAFVEWVGCAPMWHIVGWILYTPTESGGMPDLFSHEGWNYRCMLLHQGGGQVGLQCLAPGLGGPRRGGTLAQGVQGVLNHSRPVGSEELPFAERITYVDRIELLDGRSVSYYWALLPGNGQLSLRSFGPKEDDEAWAARAYGSSRGWAWDMHPNDLHHSGEPMARHYLSALVMKTATRKNGAQVAYVDGTRCVEDSWQDLSDGRFFCGTVHDPPEDITWLTTAPLAGSFEGGRYQLPMLTLGSSGLSDPEVPGGLALHLAGSHHLEGLDGCRYEQEVVPDLAVYPRELYDAEGPGEIVGDVYRFGKDDQDIIGVMYTNQRRDWCPGGAPTE